MRGKALPDGYEEASRGRFRLVARAGLLPLLTEAGALDGVPPERWGERLGDVGGGRRPLIQVCLSGYPDPLLVKRLRRGGWLGRLFFDLTRPERALREILVVELLREEQVLTPAVLGARLERRFGLARVELMTSLVASACDLMDWLLVERAPRERGQVLAAAGRQVAAMHQVGVIHQDLNLRNLLVDAQGRVHLLDLGRSRRGDRSERRAAANLARLYRSAVKRGLVPERLRMTDLVRFLKGYRPRDWQSLFQQVAVSFRRGLPFHRVSWWLSGVRRG
ncbi:MAG: lipopolysaccharide kinase InaA family protein [Planctomycetota bacterium]